MNFSYLRENISNVIKIFNSMEMSIIGDYPGRCKTYISMLVASQGQSSLVIPCRFLEITIIFLLAANDI